MNIEFDTSEVDRLAATLAAAGPEAVLESRKVLQRGALNIKNGMRRDFSGHAYAPSIPRAITYDTILRPYGAEAEIGVDKNGPQGGLGNILAFGTSRNAAVVDHTAALRRELPALEKYLGDVGVKAVE